MPSTTERRTIDIRRNLSDKIKVRYADVNPSEHGTQNMVIDAYYPRLVRKALEGGRPENVVSKRTVAISDFIAKEMNVAQMPIQDMCAILGYKEKDIKAILNAAKNKASALVLLGFGGTGTNAYHWIDKLCKWTNVVDIFTEIIIYDDDYIDLTNIFRIPFSIEYTDTVNYENRKIPKAMIAGKTVMSRLALKAFQSRMTDQFSTRESIIYYGAPDIQTRQIISRFSDNPIQFISGTHGDDSCSLYVNPPQDTDLQVESYGMINLSVFFMNQLRMTIELLNIIGTQTDLKTSRELFEFSFAKYYREGTRNAFPTSRTYNFPISENNLVVDDMDAPVATAEDTADESETALAEQDLIVEEFTIPEGVPF
jgi:hypothetical protein